MSILEVAHAAVTDAIASHGDVVSAALDPSHQSELYRVSREDERVLIASAQAGDETAKEALILANAGSLGAAVARRPSDLAREDAIAGALSEFWAAVWGYDFESGDGLAGRVSHHVYRGVTNEMTARWPVHVPRRILERFHGIMSRADGDPEAGARLAPRFSMSSRTFHAVYAVTHGALSDADLASVQADIEEEADTEMMAGSALRALDPGRDRDVTLYAYGFETGDALSDAEIVEYMSERELSESDFERGDRVISRPTVQRARARALATMREALAVPVPA